MCPIPSGIIFHIQFQNDEQAQPSTSTTIIIIFVLSLMWAFQQFYSLNGILSNLPLFPQDTTGPVDLQNLNTHGRLKSVLKIILQKTAALHNPHSDLSRNGFSNTLKVQRWNRSAKQKREAREKIIVRLASMYRLYVISNEIAQCECTKALSPFLIYSGRTWNMWN